jgi:hypothetical protein
MPLDIQVIRDKSEGRGLFGKGEIYGNEARKLNEARRSGVDADQKVIGEAKSSAVDAIMEGVNWAAGGVEKGAQGVDHAIRGAEMVVKVAAKDGMEIAGGLAEDAVDVLGKCADTALTGLYYAEVGTAVTLATPVVLAGGLAAGMVELGQRGAAGLAELRAATNGLVLRGFRAAAAAVDAWAMRHQGTETTRVESVREENKDRIRSIRDKNLAVWALGKIKGGSEN